MHVYKYGNWEELGRSSSTSMHALVRIIIENTILYTINVQKLKLLEKKRCTCHVLLMC